MPMEIFGYQWEKDSWDGRYYLDLNNGDFIGYDDDREEFSLNNYWSCIDCDRVESLLKRHGVLK